MANQNHDWFTRNREDPSAPQNAAPNPVPSESEVPESDQPTGPTPDDIWAPGNEAWLATHVTSRATDLPEQPPVLGGTGPRPGDFTRVQPGGQSVPLGTAPGFDPGNPPEPNPTWSEQDSGYLAPNNYPSGAAGAGPDPSNRPPEMPAPPTVHRARENQPLSHPSAAYPPASTPSAAYPPASNTSEHPPAPPQRQAPLAPPPGYHDQPMAPQSLSVQGFGPADGPPPAGPTVQPLTDGSPPQPPARNRSRLLLIITAAVLALALVVFLALRYGGKKEAPPPPPSSAVRTYLDALTRSDAMAARAQLTEVPADDALLNEQVLSASQQAAPLRVASVIDGTGGQVTANYTLAGEQLTTLFNTARQPDGSYRVDGLVSVDLPAFGKLPLLVNGIDMAGRGKVKAFPGRYQLTTGLPFIGYAKPELTVTGPDRGARTEATPVITPQGVEALRKAARSKLDECLRSHDLVPPGCVLGGSTDGAPVVPDSVTWKVSNDPFAEAQPRLGYGNPTRVEFDTEFVSRIELRFKRTPTEVSGTDKTFGVRVTADLGGPDAPRDLKFDRR